MSEPKVPWHISERGRPTTDDPRFFVAKSRFDTGVVHVQRDFWLPPGLYSTEDERKVAVLMQLHYFVGMCGARRRYDRTCGLGEFADERICARCVKTVPEHLRPRLFEHPT